MKILTLHFSECEHNGDLQSYVNDIVESGGNIKSSSINYEEENAVVVIELNDYNDFYEKFKRTNAFDFSNLSI